MGTRREQFWYAVVARAGGRWVTQRQHVLMTPVSPCPRVPSRCPRVQELCLLLPGARRMNRGRAELGALVGACRAAGVTDLLVLHETRGRPGQWGRGLLGGPLGWGYGVATLPSRLGSLSLPSIPI